MKFVSLGEDRAHKQRKLDTPARAILEPTKPIAASHQIRTYTELRQQIHHDLRIQHPEWVQRNGESPMCDSYEARLMQLLGASVPRESNESVAAIDRESTWTKLNRRHAVNAASAAVNGKRAGSTTYFSI